MFASKSLSSFDPFTLVQTLTKSLQLSEFNFKKNVYLSNLKAVKGGIFFSVRFC